MPTRIFLTKQNVTLSDANIGFFAIHILKALHRSRINLIKIKVMIIFALVFILFSFSLFLSLLYPPFPPHSLLWWHRYESTF